MPKQSRISGAISVTIAQAVVLILGYVTHLWIGRVLGPAPYGTYGVVLSLQTILGLILTLGVPMAVSRFVAQSEKYAQAILKEALRIQLAIAIITAVAILIASPLLSRVLGDPALQNLIRFTALVILFQAGYPIYTQFLSGMHRFNRQAGLTITYAISKLVGALSLIYVLEVYGAFAGFAIGGIIATILGWFWTRKVGGSKPHRLPLKDFLTFAGSYVFILIGLQILISLDLFMVKALLHDDTQTGFYNAAVTLSRIPYLLLQALTFILLPSVSALTKTGATQQQAITFIRDTFRYLIALIVPGVLLAATTSRGLITLFFSREYITAAPALSILMVGLGSLAFYLLLITIVAGAGKAKVGLLVTGSLLFVSGLLGFTLIPRYQLLGAAWQTTITGLLGLAILATYTLVMFKIRFPVRSTINICIASVLAILPTYVWPDTPLLLIPLYLLAGGIFAVTLFILGEVTPADRQRIAAVHPLLAWIAPKADS